MGDFFRYVTELPAGSGFEMFGTIHLVWLFGILLFSIIIALFYKGIPEAADGSSVDSNKYFTKRKFRMIIGLIMPVISIYRDAVLVITGHFDRFYLPLHLCGMALWIGALYCFTRWRFVGVVYVLLCVPGALSALIFPDWVDYPLWNYMHIHDFISHGLIVSWGLCLVVSDELVPEWKEIWMPVVFGIIGVMILTPVNKWIGTNYWFLSSPSAGSPLVPIIKLTGERWYVVGYILFVTVVVLIWLGSIRLIKHILERR